MWDSEDGRWIPRNGYDDAAATMVNLLKSRRTKDMPGWMNLSGGERLAFDNSDGDYICPTNAETGAEYVEACAWYDRVEAELAGASRMQHQRPNVSCEILDDALRLAMPGSWTVSGTEIVHDGILFWSRVGGMWQGNNKKTVKSNRLVRLLTKTRPPVDGPQVDVSTELYDAGLKFAGISSTRHTDYPVKAQTGELYLRWCAFEDYCLAAIAGEGELAEVKAAWEGLIPAPPADEGIRKAAKSLAEIVIREATEQPWERQARVAASAGYAQARPLDMLSGMRSVNGWAVSGFAVTDAHSCPEAATGRNGVTHGDATQMFRRLNPAMTRGLNSGRTQSKWSNFTEL